MLCATTAIIIIVPSVCCIPIPDTTNETRLLSYHSTATDNERTFSYNLDDGQQRSETISIANVGPNDEKEISVQGSFSFTGSDGKLYLVEYIADKNGYQPKIMILESTPTFSINVNGNEDSLLNGQVLKSLVG